MSRKNKKYSIENTYILAYHFFTQKDNTVQNLMNITGMTESVIDRRLNLIFLCNMKKLSETAKSNIYEQFRIICNGLIK